MSYSISHSSTMGKPSTQYKLTQYLASRTGDISYARRTPEGNLHQLLDDSSPIQRKQQDQQQERTTTRRFHLAQAVYSKEYSDN